MPAPERAFLDGRIENSPVVQSQGGTRYVVAAQALRRCVGKEGIQRGKRRYRKIGVASSVYHQRDKQAVMNKQLCSFVTAVPCLKDRLKQEVGETGERNYSV